MIQWQIVYSIDGDHKTKVTGTNESDLREVLKQIADDAARRSTADPAKLHTLVFEISFK